jgi:hypothetical protein
MVPAAVSSVPGWLTAVAWISLAAGFLSAGIIVFDLVRHPQKMAVMNWVWPITALYAGPLSLLAYWMFGRSTGRTKAFWEAVAVGATHCGAGCTLGDIIAEFALLFTGFTIAGSVLLARYFGDYAFAYAFGIAFQYFAIVPMRGLSFREGVWAAIKADTLSLTAFEVGLFGWMALMHFVIFQPALRPDTAAYWFMMQIGMVVGYATSYPMNWWLIRSGIKETM